MKNKSELNKYSKYPDSVNKYFNYYDEYCKKYDFFENIVVINELGIFCEMYSCPLENKGPNLLKISKMLNIWMSQYKLNLQICGFPKARVDTYISKLLSNNYIVVLLVYNKSNTLIKDIYYPI